ncbi:MAG: TlpA disulfide reductase family protein [Proteobacteria bacterium]|nr:TlpA disulfide reductase family protein [Pseudomonadota bacterium]MCZ6783657.1 TlpA disulfide reductase family protein [Pseudomonadota bacterium]
MAEDGRSRLAPWIVGGAVLLVGVALIAISDDVPPPLQRGVPAPNFALAPLGGGERVSLSHYDGQVVLVNFWATWCKPCEDEMPAMQRLHRSLQGEPFELLAISVDRGADDVAAFRERLGLVFPILLDPEQIASRAYQTTGFPETLLIDHRGRLVERYIGPRDWDDPVYLERIRRLLEGV